MRPRDKRQRTSDSSGGVRYWLPPDEDMSLASGNDDGTYSSLTLTVSGRNTLAVSLDYQTLFTSVPTFIQVIR